MIAYVLSVIQKEFEYNWPGLVQIGYERFDPSKDLGESWIQVDVEPIDNETLSYGGCVAKVHALYVTCYHRNQVQAAKLADEVIRFIQQRQLDEVYTRTWRPVAKGMKDNGKAFYKLSIPLELIAN